MISVDEALEYVLKHFQPLEPEKVEILDALDRVLAEDVYSDMDIPPFDNSAMDGYAVRAVDTAGASPEAPSFDREIKRWYNLCMETTIESSFVYSLLFPNSPILPPSR